MSKSDIKKLIKSLIVSTQRVQSCKEVFSFFFFLFFSLLHSLENTVDEGFEWGTVVKRRMEQLLVASSWGLVNVSRK